jgi:T-complex protein 1 subunit zeta
MMAKEGMVGLRRAKRRNMERLVLACGGTAVNSLDDLTPDVLGYADLVYEESLGDDKFTFVEGVKVAKSVTLLIRGPSKHSIEQIKDAVNDGLKTVRNAIADGALVHGAGCVEAALHSHLLEYAKSVTGKAKLGILAFADAISVIPKTLAENSGFDPQESFIKLQEAHARGFNDAGFNVDTGEACRQAELSQHSLHILSFTDHELEPPYSSHLVPPSS